MRNNFNHLGMGLHIYFFVSFIYLIEIDFDIDIDTDLDITILLHIYIYIYMTYDISHRIHGAGIYANIGGILMGSMLPYIAAPWILWDISYIYIYTPYPGDSKDIGVGLCFFIVRSPKGQAFVLVVRRAWHGPQVSERATAEEF